MDQTESQTWHQPAFRWNTIKTIINCTRLLVSATCNMPPKKTGRKPVGLDAYRSESAAVELLRNPLDTTTLTNAPSIGIHTLLSVVGRDLHLRECRVEDMRDRMSLSTRETNPVVTDLTVEQQQVVDFINGDSCQWGIVEAVAGSGKTRVVESCAQAYCALDADSSRTILLTAFNRQIAVELILRMTAASPQRMKVDCTKIHVSTLHGLALELLRQAHRIQSEDEQEDEENKNARRKYSAGSKMHPFSVMNTCRVVSNSIRIRLNRKIRDMLRISIRAPIRAGNEQLPWYQCLPDHTISHVLDAILVPFTHACILNGVGIIPEPQCPRTESIWTDALRTVWPSIVRTHKYRKTLSTKHIPDDVQNLPLGVRMLFCFVTGYVLMRPFQRQTIPAQLDVDELIYLAVGLKLAPATPLTMAIVDEAQDCVVWLLNEIVTEVN